MLKSASELQEEYSQFVNTIDENSFDWGLWLPEFGKRLRPLLPGELCVVIAETAAGKTSVLQNIAVKCTEDVAMFEMELPGIACFERFAAISNGIAQAEVEKAYKNNRSVYTNPFDHVYVCDTSRLNTDKMISIINKGKENGIEPKLIMVDYIGLMDSKGKSKYEKVSAAAEDLKVMAKVLNVPVIIATQMKRKGEEGQPGINDAKDSGSIENSAQVVIALWREGDRGERMCFKILKSTRGGAGHDVITTDFDGPTLRIKSKKPNVDDIMEGLPE